MVRRVTPLVILALLMLGSVSVSDTIAPTWNFNIENMTTFAMSENGRYIVVGCETGPLCEKGQFYVFDQYGNTVEDGCVENEITVVDIADNGAFFIGTRNGYYYSSSSGKIKEERAMGSMFTSVSMSENAIVTGTNKEILILDENGVKTKKEVDRPVNITAINSPGTIYVAGTTDSIFLYEESTKEWEEYPVVSDPVEFAISDDGNTIVFGLIMGLFWVRGTGSSFLIPSGLSSLAMTPDGKFLVCGTRKGDILYLDESGNLKWSSKVENPVSDVSLSSDGGVVAVLCGNVVLFDSEGKNFQELKSSKSMDYLHLSRTGEVLSCISKEELFFFQLSKRENICTYEYPLPSRRSIPLDDQLTEAWSYDGVYNSAVTGDVNNDGEKEIVCSLTDGIVVLTSEGTLLWNKSFFLPRIAALDLTGDFAPETIVTSSDHMRVEVFDGKGEQLSAHDFYSRWFSAPPQNVEIYALWSGDLDGDESIEVVCYVAAGYLLEPRGLYAFEYPSFKEEWYYPVAPLLETINFADINGDGQVEIVSGSNAPCNGLQVGNTDDCHAYVYAVTPQGKELWTKQIGDAGFNRANVAVGDVNGDGNQEIVGSGWSFEDKWGSLFVLNSEGDYIAGAENEFDHSVSKEKEGWKSIMERLWI